MKAIVQSKYGAPDVLELRDIEKPALRDTDVLVRVHAAAINPLDWHDIRGLPYFVRIGNGLLKPKDRVPGVDVAGHVEAVGRNVTQLRPGDEVFGLSKGALAEYARGREDLLLPKPAALTFEQAAAVPVAALTALQALRDRGRIQPGQNVLIVGASGGVGIFPYRLPSRSGRTSLVYAAPGTWKWFDRSAQTTSLTTPVRISPRVGSDTTSWSIWQGLVRCRIAGGR
jgi:NADPH:quinone reductase-like Zn-dependent oxidoreductase